MSIVNNLPHWIPFPCETRLVLEWEETEIDSVDASILFQVNLLFKSVEQQFFPAAGLRTEFFILTCHVVSVNIHIAKLIFEMKERYKLQKTLCLFLFVYQS